MVGARPAMNLSLYTKTRRHTLTYSKGSRAFAISVDDIAGVVSVCTEVACILLHETILQGLS